MAKRIFYEFFAGGGMVRAAIQSRGWDCVFANDIDPKKASTYKANWGEEHLNVKDVGKVKIADLPSIADLTWASFPCQDLSLAGGYTGLSGDRSGVFWPFWKLIKQLKAKGRGPKIIILENVYGTLTSNNGKDFLKIAKAFADAKYNFGCAIIDAVHWLPQSRPRLFIIGIRGDILIPENLKGAPSQIWHPEALQQAQQSLSQKIRKRWVWWNIPKPRRRTMTLDKLMEENSSQTKWHSPKETKYILSLMAPLHRKKLSAVIAETKKTKSLIIGSIYKRMRNGVQRAEIRFDDIAGCLRTPRGGSSRQIFIFINKGEIRTRLLSNRELARLMGLPDNYKLPTRYNDTYHLCGDGVAVPAVKWLVQKIIEPVLINHEDRKAKNSAQRRAKLKTKSRYRIGKSTTRHRTNTPISIRYNARRKIEKYYA